MCGRIGLPQFTWAQFVAWQRGELNWDEVKREPSAWELSVSYNVKPTNQVSILYADGSSLIGSDARWWFVPHWHRGDLRDWKGTTFNARIETAHEKPTFRTAWKHGRCAIPASGYFEWTGEKGSKQPWWITAETNAPAIFFAGLHSQLSDGTRTCTILTRPALHQIAHIHARTPVILSQAEFNPWLTGEIGAGEAKANLGTTWDGRMRFHKVGKFGIHDDGPEQIEPIER